MKPWCAEGDLPTAANLDLYLGWKSCVGWHCHNEPLFGKCGDAMLIVAVSLGSSAVFRWSVSPVRMMKVARAGLAMVTFLSWMVNARTSSFIGRALVGNRNGLTLRSVGSNSMFLLVLCLRQGWHAVCQRVRRVHQFLLWGMLLVAFFWVFWFLLGVLCIWRVQALLVSLFCTRLGLLRCASCWTRPLGGGRWRHYLCNLWGEYLKNHKTACMYSWMQWKFGMWKPYMLALVGRPSLHGDYAWMVYWDKGALRRNCRQKQYKTSFSPYWVFLFSRNPTKSFWGLIFWAGGQDILLHPPSPNMLAWNFIMLVAGLLMVILLLVLVLIFLLLLSIEKLIPARVRSEWSRLRGKGISSVWAPASQVSSHVGNAGLVSSVCVALSLLCPRLLLLSLSLSLIVAVLWVFAPSCVW